MKQLSEILSSIEVLSFTATGEVTISGLTFDSRKVSKGDCFFAVRGTQSDGHNYIGKAIEAGADIIMLDNMDNNTMTEAVRIIKAADKGIKTEASGNMSIPRLKEVAATGVDYISVGALTHTVKGMDISMNIEVE